MQSLWDDPWLDIYAYFSQNYVGQACGHLQNYETHPETIAALAQQPNELT